MAIRAVLVGGLLLLGSSLAAAKGPAPPRLAKFGDFVQHLSWSPDGKKFLFTRIHKGKMGLWTMNADGSDVKPLFAKEANPTLDGQWSADGKKIIFVYDRLQGTDGKFQIDICNADGTEQKNLIPHKGGAFEESPRWSPDGKSLAWASTRDKNQEIFVAAADGKNPKRLTTGFPSNSPSWSPDSKKIAFTSGRTGNLEIFVMNADGSGVRQLTKNPTMDYWPVWSPDGKRIAFTSNRDGNYEIYVMDADGGKPRNLTRHAGWDNFAAWSPDSKKIAFVSNRDGGYGIFVMDAGK